jgi:hypothetical protein
MKNNLTFVASAVLVASAMISGVGVRAEDLPQIKTRQEFSLTQGFGEPSLPVFKRTSIANQSEVSATLIDKLRPGSTHQSTNVRGALRTTGERWTLEVSTAGSAAEYHDLAVEASSHSLGRPLLEEMSASELEQKGRSYVATRLASQIVLGTSEELVAVRADYRTEGGQDLKTGQVSSAVVANRIVFGRTIGGVPVVGNGSKVILTFTNDGSLESFHYDWPAYQAGASQNLVDASQILSRAQKVAAVRSGVAAPTSKVAGGKYPVALTPNTQLQALDCGYYDAGSSAKQTQSVQPGCTYLTVSQDPSGSRQGYAGAIPAGASFTVDAGWLETRILSTR